MSSIVLPRLNRPRSNRLHRRHCEALALAAGLLLFATVSTGQPTRTLPPTAPFLQIGDLAFEYGGERLESARIFHSKVLSEILVLAPELPAPVIFTPRGRIISTVSRDALTETETGRLIYDTDAKRRREGSFTLVGNLPTFELRGKEGRFTKRPPLTGPTDIADLAAYNPRYGNSAYNPRDLYIERLKGFEGEVHVKLYYGTWCSICQELVPHIVRVARDLDGTNISFSFYGMPEPPITDHPEAKKMDLKTVPTGIIYVNGEETTRVTGHNWRHPELALHNALIEH